MNKKIVIICGHPNPETLTGSILEHYHKAADSAGHEVKRFNISEMNFDPILHKGYTEIQQLEEDLFSIQQAIQEADHIVIAYPNWWCSMPALLKGLFDRIWLPGFAFNFNKETKKIEKHLTGRTARVFILNGTNSPIKTWWKFGDYTNEIQYAILEFAGIKTQVTPLGPCNNVSDAKKAKWVREVEVLGRLAK